MPISNAKIEIMPKPLDKEVIYQKQMQILNAAIKLFAKKGFHATTMREIALASGINLGLIYNYVSAKEDILFLFHQWLDKKFRRIYEKNLIAAANQSPFDQIKNHVKDILEVVVEYRREIRTSYTEVRHLSKKYLEVVLQCEADGVRYLEQVIIRGQEQGVFRVTDTNYTANSINMFLLLFSLRGWNFKKNYTFDEQVKLATEHVLGMLRVEQ